MKKAREIVNSILKERTVENIYFVGCGGSLVGFYPAKYFLSCEAKKLKVPARRYRRDSRSLQSGE